MVEDLIDIKINTHYIKATRRVLNVKWSLLYNDPNEQLQKNLDFLKTLEVNDEVYY